MGFVVSSRRVRPGPDHRGNLDHHRWFRRSHLDPFAAAGAPVPLGGQITGRLLAGPAIRAGSAGEMTLQCQERVDVQVTQASIRIQTRIHYEMAKAFVVPPDAGTAGIPVRFDVPIGTRATDEGLTKWVLSVTVAVPGLDADMAFEIPVYRA